MEKSVNEPALCDNSNSFVESTGNIPAACFLLRKRLSLIFMEETNSFRKRAFQKHARSILIGVERYSAYRCYRFHINVSFAFVLLLKLQSTGKICS